MKKNSKFLLLSMAAFFAMTSSAVTSTAQASIPGLGETKRAAKKEKRIARRLENVTERADRGQAEGKSQRWLDNRGVREDELQAKLRIARENKVRLINTHDLPEFASDGDVLAKKEVAKKESSVGQEKGNGVPDEEGYVILDNGMEIRLRDLQVYTFGEERVTSNGQGTDVASNGQGTDPGKGNGQGTDPNNGGTDPNNGGTDPNNGGTDPNNGGTDPNNGGTDPGTGGTPPKNEKKKTEGGDRQEQKDPKDKKGEEKKATTPPKNEKKPVSGGDRKDPPKTTTPPKNVKKPGSGGDRQPQPDDKKAKEKARLEAEKKKAEQERIAKEKAAQDEAARIAREKARLEQLEKERKERQAQIDLKNKEKEKQPECKLPSTPVVGEAKCLPVEEEKEVAKEEGKLDVKAKYTDRKVEKKDAEYQFSQTAGMKRTNSKKNVSAIKAKVKGKDLTASELELVGKFFQDLNAARNPELKVSGSTGVKKTDEGTASGTDSGSGRQANTSTSHGAR